MTYIKINDTLYPAEIIGKMEDREWGKRESKAITLEMDYATAAELFVDGLEWSIVMESNVVDENGSVVLDESGEPVVKVEEYDNSEYTVAGPISDNRDGTVTAKMGKPTDGEMLAELLEVLNND